MQLPGRDMRRTEACCQSLTGAADAVAAELLQGPTEVRVLFGHSMGALLAFETARRLQDAGQRPVALVVSARRGPTIGERLEPIAHLPEAAFVAQVQERYGGIPPIVLEDPELRALLVPTLQSDIAMLERYRFEAGALLECPVHAYGGVEDRHASHDDLAAWHLQTRVPGHVRQFPGGHFYFQASPAAADNLLATLRTDVRTGPGADSSLDVKNRAGLAPRG